MRMPSPLESKRISKVWGRISGCGTQHQRSRHMSAAAKRSARVPPPASGGRWRTEILAQSVFSRYVPDGAHTFCTLLPLSHSDYTGGFPVHAHTQACETRRVWPEIQPACIPFSAVQPALGMYALRQPSVCARAPSRLCRFSSRSHSVQLGTSICALGRNGGRNSVSGRTTTTAQKRRRRESPTPVHPELIAVARTISPACRFPAFTGCGCAAICTQSCGSTWRPAHSPLVQIQKGQLQRRHRRMSEPGAALAPSVCTGQPRNSSTPSAGNTVRARSSELCGPRQSAHQLCCREIGGGGIIGEKRPRLMGTAALQKRARHPAKKCRLRYHTGRMPCIHGEYMPHAQAAFNAHARTQGWHIPGTSPAPGRPDAAFPFQTQLLQP